MNGFRWERGPSAEEWFRYQLGLDVERFIGQRR